MNNTTRCDVLSLAHLTLARVKAGVAGTIERDLIVETHLVVELLDRLPSLLLALRVWHAYDCSSCRFCAVGERYAYCCAQPPAVNGNGKAVRPAIEEGDPACLKWEPDAETLESYLGISGDLMCEAVANHDASRFTEATKGLGLKY